MSGARQPVRTRISTLVMALVSVVALGAGLHVPGAHAEEAGPGSAGISLRKADPAPQVTALDNRARRITVTSGTTVGQLVDQVQPATAGARYAFTVVDWRGTEKIAWEDRPAQDDPQTKGLDMLTTSDRLVVTAERGGAARYEIRVPGAAPYWNDDRYDGILRAVGSNLPDFSSDPTFDVTSSRYAHLVRQVTEGDTVVDDYTLVFRKAIADSTKAGGGTVLVPSRSEKYRTGAIQLDDNVNLLVEEGATIDFLNIVTKEFYPRSLVSFEGIDYYGFSAPIYAYDKKNIGITGGGTIEMSDTSQWFGDVDNTIRHWNFARTPVAQRDAFSLNQRIPVSLVQFRKSRNILIEGVTFGNSPFWSLNPVECENLLLRDVTVTSISSNSDGFNPESCRNVVIENNLFANQDDNIALKSGRTNNGKLRKRPAENIVIRGNVFWQGSGISVGSEAAGGVNNIYSENNFYNSLHESDESDPMGRLGRNVFRIKTANSLDATFEDIFFRNIAVGGMRENFFHIERVSDDNMWFQTAEIDNYGTRKNVPTIRDIAMSNVFSVANRATGDVDSTLEGFVEVEGSDLRPVDGLHFKDIDLTSSRLTDDKNLTLNNVTGLTMENVEVNDDTYDTEHVVRIEDVEVNGVPLHRSSSTKLQSRGDGGALDVTGRIDTDIPGFEDTGSVRASFDVDKNFAPAELTRVDDEVRFRATLTNVGASRHDLAVVAKSNRLPHYVVDDDLDSRKSADMVYHDVETFEIDVEGALRAMDVRFEYAPSLTPFHNVPVFMYGESARIVAEVTDARTGKAVEDATIDVRNQSNFDVAVDANTLTMAGIRDNAIVRNHVVITISHPRYVSKEHHFRRLVSVPDLARLATIMPAYRSEVSYRAVGNGRVTATADGAPFRSGADIDVGRRVELAATPGPGFQLEGWAVNGVPASGAQATYAFTSLADADVTAEFVRR